jgi:hypothetical protein
VRPWGVREARYYLVRSDGPRSNGPQGTGPFLRLFPASSNPFPFSFASEKRNLCHEKKDLENSH